jgi:hypothetical protein
MTDAAISLKDLLPKSSLNLGTAIEKKLDGQKSAWAPVADTVVKFAETRVRDVLDIKLLDIFLGAWSKSLDILEAIAATARDPSAVENVQLFEHTITDKEYPELKIAFLGQKLSVIRLELDLSADLTGANLEIRRGGISSVEFGEVTTQLSLLCEDTKLLPDWSEGPFNILGKIAVA